MSGTAEQARAEELVAEVRAHKSAIRRHRLQLSHARAELSTLQEACRERGIRLIIEQAQAQAEGDTHGRTNPRPRYPY